MRVIKWLDKYFEEMLLIGLLVMMTLIMGLQVVARYLFNSSMSWTEEVTRYLFVWSGFISIGYGVHKGVAIRIDMFAEKLKPKAKALLYIGNHLIELVFFLYLMPFAFRYLVQTIISGQVSTACQMPMSILQSAPFVGFVVCIIRLIQSIVKRVKALKEVDACQQ